MQFSNSSKFLIFLSSPEKSTMISNNINITPPIVILSGGCSDAVKDKMGTYRSILIEAFSIFQGTVISGGTASGISKITADIGEQYPDKITTIGYLPINAIPDPRYSYLIHTSGCDFSLAEPLQMWRDIFLNGCNPREVMLIGVNGGVISAGEYRLAITMGARVGLIRESGGSTREILCDPFWSKMVKPLEGTVDDIKRFFTHISF